MFRCDVGKHLSELREVRVTVPLMVRPVVYKTVRSVYDKKNKVRKDVVVRSSTGTEVVREGYFCSAHAGEFGEFYEPTVLDEEPKVIEQRL